MKDELIFGAFMVVVMGALTFGGYELGRTRAVAEAEQARYTANVAALDKFNAAAAAARKMQADLADRIASATITLDKERTDHAKSIESLRATVRAGTVRLSVAANCALSGSAPSASPGAAGTPVDEARADIMPRVADAIFRLAGQSADDVRDYNAVVDQYNAVRDVCNK